MPPQQGQPPGGQKPAPRSGGGGHSSGASRPPRPSSITKPEQLATEVAFLVLIIAAVIGVAINFFHTEGFRRMYVGLFNPTSLSYYDSANGSRVYVSAAEGNVRDAPGGVRIGSQPANAPGTVIDGPSTASGARFWDINFDTGPDGWVDESELLLFGRETIFSRLFGGVINLFNLVSTLISLLFLSGIIYAVIRISHVMGEQSKREKTKEVPVHAVGSPEDHTNRRWERVIAHVQSENPADWRLAILEADIILAELLDRMGYLGENVGEKLKRVEKSDFDSIDDAWEAHKVRNLVAHQGSDFVLSKREAQRIVSLYANVFHEFRYI